jgi:hypothetical protein
MVMDPGGPPDDLPVYPPSSEIHKVASPMDGIERAMISLRFLLWRLSRIRA